MTRILGPLLVAFSLVFSSDAQEPPKVKRALIEVRHGNARNLAEVLNKHFKEDKSFLAVAEMTSNTLLLSGSAEAVTDASMVVIELDRAPRQVAVDIWIAQVTPAASKGEEIPAKSLEGPIKDVKTRLEELHHKGSISSLRHYTLKAIENQPAALMNAEMKPIVTGMGAGGGGGGFGGKAGGRTMSITMKNVGAKFTITPRIPPDKAITLELNLEDTRLNTPDDAAVLGMDEAGLPIRATEMVLSQIETKTAVASGHAVPLQGVVTRSKSGAGQVVVIVAARLIDGK